MLLLYQFQTKKNVSRLQASFPITKTYQQNTKVVRFQDFFFNYRNLNFRGISLSLKSHFHAMLKIFHVANATAKNIPRKFKKNIKKTDYCTAATPDNNNNCKLQAKTVETALYLRYLYLPTFLYLQLQYLHYHILFARYFWTNWKNLLFYCH